MAPSTIDPLIVDVVEQKKDTIRRQSAQWRASRPPTLIYLLDIRTAL
jgi:hypothetical protein